MGILTQPDSNVFIFDPSVSSFTLQNAIDACTADKGDVIIWVGGGHEVSTPVLFNKAGITLIGTGRGYNRLAAGEGHAIYAAASLTDEPAAKITEACRIIEIGFASRDTGATFFSGAAALIGGEADATPFGVHMLNCRFPKWGLDNRIGLAIEGSSDVLIEECGFEGVGGAFDSGIYVQGATQNLEVRNCRFRQCTYAITHGAFAGGGPHALYKGNVLEDAKLLDSGGNAATAHVTGNFLETATNATSYDDTVGTLQGQGIQFSGNQYSE
tara:strand:- start:3332 stop:4141 length:810 start_codon:yes stop_codon:yes gene_type:complete